MIVDRRKKSLVELGTLDAGQGFIFENEFYMVIERGSIEIDSDYVPALNLKDGDYAELDKRLDVERCRYEINVYN